MRKRFCFVALTVFLGASINVSCQQEAVDKNDLPEESLENVRFTTSLADDLLSTKTTMNRSGSNVTFNWQTGDKLAIRQIHHRQGFTEPIIQMQATDGLTSTSNPVFTAGFPVVNLNKILEYPGHSGKKFMYQAFYPSSHAQLNPSNKGDLAGCVRLAIPYQQKPKANSFDPAADLLYSDPVYQATQSASDIAGSSPTLKFNRLVAIGIMTLNNLDIPSGDKPSTVEFISMSQGLPLAGNVAARHTTDEFSLENIICSFSKNSITLDCANLSVSNKTLVLHFTCLPAAFTAGKTFKVRVTTKNNRHYEKTVTVPSGKSLEFFSGKATAFSVNMNGTAVSGTTSDSVAPVSKTVTMMTYNVCIFDMYNRLVKNNSFLADRNIYDDIAAVINATGATLVGLNEVDNNRERTGYVNQASQLKSRMNAPRPSGQKTWKHHFAAAIAYSDNEGYGNAVLFDSAEHPEITSRKILLPNKDAADHIISYPIWEPDGTQSGSNTEETRCVSVLETEDCVFATVHLGLCDAGRQRQVDSLNKWFNSRYFNCDKPVFLCGDFNATPEIVPGDYNAMINVDELMGPDWVRVTADMPLTHPSKRPFTNKRLDHFFVYQHSTVHDVTLTSEMVVSNRYDQLGIGTSDNQGMILLSDHYPVVVTFTWTPADQLGFSSNFGDNNKAGKNTALVNVSNSF